MDTELRYLLEQGPTSVKELSRLTGKSTSSLYKALKSDEIKMQESPNGRLYFVAPSEKGVEAPEGTGKTRAQANPASETAVAPAPSKRGRKASFAGKQLYPTARGTEEGNPRRKDSMGFKSLQIVIDRPGITTEDFVAAGGRLNDLRWDVDHGHVRAE